MDKKIAKIEIDGNLCIGAASCMATAASVFELDAEDKAVMKLKGGAKTSAPTDVSALEAPAADDALMLAAQSCPMLAIKLFAADGTQIFPAA